MSHLHRTSVFLVALAVWALVSLQALPARADPPRVVVEGEGAEGLLITTTAPELRRDIRLFSTSDAELANFRVRVALQVSGGGDPTDTVVTVGPESGEGTLAALPPHGTAVAHLRATLNEVTAYSGALTLLYGSESRAVPITVTRNRPQLTASFDAIDTVRRDLPPWPSVAEFDIRLQENGGRSLTLDHPTLLAGALHDPLGTTSSVTLNPAVLVVEPGGDTKALPNPFRLEPGQRHLLRVRVPNLGAGEYTAKLVVGMTSATPIEQAVTLQVRRPWWLAALLIALGVALGAVLRDRVKNDLPRLQMLATLQTLRAELEESARASARDRGEVEVLRVVRRDLTALASRIATGQEGSGAAAKVQALDRRLALLPEWVAVRRRVLAMPQDEYRAALDATLSEVAVALQASLDVAALEALGQRLRAEAAEQVPLVALRQELAANIARMSEDVTMLRSWRPQGAAEPTWLTEAETALRAATPGAREGSAAELRAAYDAARRKYLVALAEDLAARVSGEPAAGYTPEDWSALQARSEQAREAVRSHATTDAGAAFEAYQTGLRGVLGDLAAHLQAEVVRRRQERDKLPPEKREEFDAKLQALLAGLESAQAALGADHLPQAMREYERARAAFTTLEPPPAQPGGAGKPMGQSASVPRVNAPPVPAGVSGTAPEEPGHAPGVELPPKLRTILESADQRARRIEWGVLVFAGFSGVMSGLGLLWLPSPTWGGWFSYLTAALWGFGLHEVSGRVFSLAVERDKLKS